MNGAPPCPHRGDDPRSVLLVLSHLRWDFVFQRPQQLMTRAAATHEVLFFEEPVEGDVAEPRLERMPRQAGVTVLRPVLPRGLAPADSVAAQRALLAQERAAIKGRPLVTWFYSPMFMPVAGDLPADAVVYDCMDELSAFRGAPPEMLEMESRLLARADLVFTGGRSLYEAKRDRHTSVHCFPSSIDAAHFGRARESVAEPEALRGIAHPRIGFFGVVDERMDLGLVAAMAALRPDWSFCMIGPVVKIDPASLPQAPNLHWLGPCDYADLPEHLAHWDLGFMPFALNESTRFISPTKTPEFLAAGLPLVSTPVTDVVRDYGDSGLVEIAADAPEMAGKLALLLDRPKETWLKRVDTRLAAGSWDRTWDQMAGLLHSVQDNRPREGGLLQRVKRVLRPVEAAHV
ncbi:glycosyltransferase family 1 protein [Roseomonas sp. AR75]|uniref:glycosyltransferase family 1 protein n=1 Tax=Roseomonas sp. AR75 TaxID=2562311 RepID=UPI0010C0CAF2|nr:glycosyltransferase family 1 protein [Roseomonas sp. AR75]